MIEVSFDSGEVGRQVHWSTAIHCSVGEYSDFEEDALWKANQKNTDRTIRSRPTCPWLGRS